MEALHPGDAARRRLWLLLRAAAGNRADRRNHRQLCDRAAAVASPGGVRTGRDRRHRRTGICQQRGGANRSEEHTSELQSLMRISYAVFCLTKKKTAMST